MRGVACGPVEGVIVVKGGAVEGVIVVVEVTLHENVSPSGRFVPESQ